MTLTSEDISFILESERSLLSKDFQYYTQRVELSLGASGQLIVESTILLGRLLDKDSQRY